MTPAGIRTITLRRMRRGDVATRAVTRPMRPRDVPAVAAIEAAARARPWPAAVFREELARSDRTYLVAAIPRRGASGARVIGYAGALVAAGEAHVLTVVVDPRHRRRGVGRALTAGLVAAVRGRGAKAVTLEVRESNVAALALYEQLGFVSYGLRPGYYQDTGEAARILWLHDVRHRGRGVATDDAGRG